MLNVTSSYNTNFNPNETRYRYKYLLRGILKTRIRRGLSWSLTGSGRICSWILHQSDLAQNSYFYTTAVHKGKIRVKRKKRRWEWENSVISDGRISRWTCVSQFHLGSSCFTCFGREHLEINGTVFYRPDILPVTQPSVSKHWRKHKAITLTSGLASSFLHPQPDSWWKNKNSWKTPSWLTLNETKN